MRITKLFTLLVILSLALISLNCEKSEEPQGAIPEKYVGTWEAKITIEGTLIEYKPADPPGSTGIDVRLLGGEIKVILDRDANYNLTFVDPLEGTDTESGKVILDEENNMITMTPSGSGGELLIFLYEWEDDNTLMLTTQAEFDYGNGDVLSIVTIILKRTA